MLSIIKFKSVSSIDENVKGILLFYRRRETIGCGVSKMMYVATGLGVARH